MGGQVTLMRRALKRLGATAGLVGLLAGAGLGLLPGRAAAAEQPAEQQLITVMPSGGGMNGSKWLGELVMTNPSLTEPADGRVVLYAQNTTGDDDTSPSIPYTIWPRGNIVIHDPVGTAGLSGNCAVKVIPDDGIMPTVLARFYNEQDQDQDGTATELSQFMSGVPRSAWLQPGDTAWFTGPDTTITNDLEAARWNLFAYGEAGARVKLELFDDVGQYVTTTTRTLPEHGGTQWTDAVRTLFERDPRSYDTIKITLLSGTGWVDASWVQNNQDTPGMDDGGLQRPNIERLVEEETLVVAPVSIKANDPWTAYGKVVSRPGTIVQGMGVTGYGTVLGSTNTLVLSGSSSATTPGTYPIEMSYTIIDEQGVEWPRTGPTSNLIVTPEHDYTNIPDSYAITRSKIGALSALIGDNINTVYRGNNTHYFAGDVATFLDAYTNGTSGDGDPELDSVQVYDTINRLSFVMATGGTASWDGFTESQMAQIKSIYNLD